MSMSGSEVYASAVEWPAPETGLGADCYAVACTAVVLALSRICSQIRPYEAARHAVTLHRISGMLHRLDEAACNGELTPAQERKAARLERGAQTIAERYGLHAYHQGDPRGCALYLVTAEQRSSGQYHQGEAIIRLGK